MKPVDLISHSYIFEITDGRIIRGILIAIDDQSNLLVTNAIESYISRSNYNHKREIGLVSIRKHTIKRVKMVSNELNDLKNNTKST